MAGAGAVARRVHAPTSTASGATPTCCSGTATSGSIDHGASLYFHHGWPGGTDPASGSPRRRGTSATTCSRHYAAECPRADEEIAARSTAAASPRCSARCPTSGSSRCPARRRPTRCARRTSTSSPPGSATRQWLPGGARMSATRLAYQYVVLRCVPARRARGVRQRRRGALLPGRGLPRRPPGRSTRERLRALDPRRRRRPRVRSPSPSLEWVCRGDERGGGRTAAASDTRFGFLKAPRSTVLQPGPVHGGMTGDPARQLEHLVSALVG